MCIYVYIYRGVAFARYQEGHLPGLVPSPDSFYPGFGLALEPFRRDETLIGLMTSDRKLEAFREGSKQRIYGT